MYHTRMRRTTPKRTPNSHPRFFIRRSEIAFDNRVKYIESVLAVLIESRFGPGCVEPVVIDMSDRPEPKLPPLHDRCDRTNGRPNSSKHRAPDNAGPLRSPLGRAGYQVMETAYRRAKQMGIVDIGLTAHSSGALAPNQGRGSP